MKSVAENDPANAYITMDNYIEDIRAFAQKTIDVKLKLEALAELVKRDPTLINDEGFQKTKMIYVQELNDCKIRGQEIDLKTRELSKDERKNDYGVVYSDEQWQAITRQIKNAKYDIEENVTLGYEIVNGPLAAGKARKLEEPVNEHCKKDTPYYMRQWFTEYILRPISDNAYKMPIYGDNPIKDYMRNWFKDRFVIYVTDTMRDSVMALYEAVIREDTLARNLVVENCYRMLDNEQRKWVIREVDMMRKMDTVDIFKIGKSEDFAKLMEILCVILFQYGQTSDGAMIIPGANEAMSRIDVKTIMLMVAIPQLVNFAFPVDAMSVNVHNVNTETLQHAVEYNENWTLEAAHVYWFWTQSDKSYYTNIRINQPVKDLDGIMHAVPEDLIEIGFNYTRQVKNWLFTVAKNMGEKLTKKPIFSSSMENRRRLLAPWTFSETITDGLITYTRGVDIPAETSARNAFLRQRYIEPAANCQTTAEFLNLFANTMAQDIPPYVWKSFNALSGKKMLVDKPLRWVPNNFTFYSREYEATVAIISTINSIYWTHGYINDGKRHMITDKDISIWEKQYKNNFVCKGGLAFKLPDKDETIYNREPYKTFDIIMNDDKTGVPMIEVMELYKKVVAYNEYIPEKDETLLTFKPVDLDITIAESEMKEFYTYNWNSAHISFFTQDAAVCPLRAYPDSEEGMKYLLSFIGADCELIDYSTILLPVIEKFFSDTNNPFNNPNSYIFTYANYMIDTFNDDVDRRLINQLYHVTIDNLLKYRILFPYNMVINSNYINAVHVAMKYDKGGVKEDSTTWDKNNIVFPQHIFSPSNAPVFNVAPKMDTFNGGDNIFDKEIKFNYTPMDFVTFSCKDPPRVPADPTTKAELMNAAMRKNM